ncbi:MAG: carboxymuconolactone decarboxylase family protein [Bacteroidota bacterium]|nr:carboxymuconolactone decarboxylase family protein [Bacteroidota bacterium]
MNRKQIDSEIEKTLGIIPSMFKSIPDSTIEAEWELFKKVQLEDGPIPQKYRELMGLAIAAATKCQYCTYFHTEVAKVNGATAEEIESTIHYAKMSSGWSTYVNGLQIPLNLFKKEIDQVCNYVKKNVSEHVMT